MGTKFYEVLCDDHGIGGSGEYFGDNDAHLDIINVLYHEASLRPRLPHPPGKKNRQNWAKGHVKRAEHQF
jgi:hypothetical protein